MIVRAVMIALVLNVAAEARGEIHAAAANGDVAAVRAAIARDPALVHARGFNGRTPAHDAAIGGHVTVLEALLAAGADLTVADASGVRPLHWTVQQRHIAAVDWLIARGADPNARTAAAVPPSIMLPPSRCCGSYSTLAPMFVLPISGAAPRFTRRPRIATRLRCNC